jgi:hypothetical protein
MDICMGIDAARQGALSIYDDDVPLLVDVERWPQRVQAAA